MLSPIGVLVQMHAIAQPPHNVGSKSDEHHANRAFEEPREYVRDSPTQYHRSACERKQGQRMPESPGQAMFDDVSSPCSARRNA